MALSTGCRLTLAQVVAAAAVRCFRSNTGPVAVIAVGGTRQQPCHCRQPRAEIPTTSAPPAGAIADTPSPKPKALCSPLTTSKTLFPLTAKACSRKQMGLSRSRRWTISPSGGREGGGGGGGGGVGSLARRACRPSKRERSRHRRQCHAAQPVASRGANSRRSKNLTSTYAPPTAMPIRTCLSARAWRF
jgi:hypothetical protein